MTSSVELARGFSLAGVGWMLISAASCLVGSGDRGSAIQPASVEVDLGRVTARSEATVEFQLVNVGGRPARIVGAPSVCTARGCIEAVALPSLTPPHHSTVLRYHFRANGPGPIEWTSSVFLDIGEGSGVEVPIAFRGDVVDPGDVSSPLPKFGAEAAAVRR